MTHFLPQKKGKNYNKHEDCTSCSGDDEYLGEDGKKIPDWEKKLIKRQ